MSDLTTAVKTLAREQGAHLVGVAGVGPRALDLPPTDPNAGVFSDLKGVRIPGAFFGELAPGDSPLRWMQEMITKLLPGGADTRTLAMLHEVVREHTAGRDRPDLSVLGPEVVGLLLGSPEFQRQ